MHENESRAFSVAVACAGVVLCLFGALLLGHSGILGLLAWLLVLFGATALIQAALAWSGFYWPHGARDRNDESAGSR